MNYITIASLKKQAKKERKSNNDIKNHSESLDFIALKHNFKNWNDLINNSVILNQESPKIEETLFFNNQFKKKTLLTNLIDFIFERHVELVETFKMKNYKYLSYFIFENYLQNFKESDFWIVRARAFIEFLSYVYIKILPNNKEMDLNLFYSLSDFDKLLDIIKANELCSDEKIKYYLDTISSVFSDNNDCLNYGNSKEQFGYSKGLFNAFFNDIEQINLELEKNIDFKNKFSIFEYLSEITNFSEFISVSYFNQNHCFEQYLSDINRDEKGSLFNKYVIERHNEQVNLILKSLNTKSDKLTQSAS